MNGDLTITPFKPVWERAAERKGGERALRAMLSDPLPADELARQPDALFLSHMSKAIFQAGFSWRVVDAKWPQITEAFHGFETDILTTLTDEEWDAFRKDERLIRNPQKIAAVRGNLWFLMDLAMEHGSVGGFFADWPGDDLVGLFDLLKQRGKRLGGLTGQRFLRAAGKDTFVVSPDVVAGLRQQGLQINDKPGSKRDYSRIQRVFNQWHDETGLCYQHLSMVLSRSVGENYV